MAKFKYAGVNASGESVSGVLEAGTRSQARAELATRRIDITRVEEKKSLLSFELTKKKVPARS